jgi:hypothetical protein
LKFPRQNTTITVRRNALGHDQRLQKACDQKAYGPSVFSFLQCRVADTTKTRRKSKEKYGVHIRSGSTLTKSRSIFKYKAHFPLFSFALMSGCRHNGVSFYI